MHTWAHGSPDTCIPGPLPGFTTSEQYIIASPSSIPEQYIIASSSSIHQQQPYGEPQLDQGGSWVGLNDQKSQIVGVPAPRLQLPGSEFASMPVYSNPSPTPRHFHQRGQMTGQEDQLCQQDCQSCCHKLHRKSSVHSFRSLTNVGCTEVHMILCGQRLALRPTQMISPDSWRGAWQTLTSNSLAVIPSRTIGTGNLLHCVST